MALEKGKRAVLHVIRAGPGLNVIPVNDVAVFLFENHVDPAAVREFIERTAGAIAELDERATAAEAEKKARDDEWEARKAAKKKPKP